MPNKRYLAGRRFEWKIKDTLRYYYQLVIRSAGSKSPFDLISFGFDSIRPHYLQPRTIDNENYIFHIGFWQLKKSITHQEAAKILKNLLKDLNLESLNLFEKNFLMLPNGKRIAEMIYWQGVVEQNIPTKNRIMTIKLGIIYTLPKKKKLDKRKKRIIKVGKTLQGGEKVAQATSG
jgi:hypothetical protein